MAPQASVIIPVYNALRHLELVLAGFRRQTFTDFELIVADDGSGPEMREFVNRFAERSVFPVKYVYQPDEGFRKSRILNAAIRLAATEYLVFSDGDCVPHRRFLEAHWAHREPRTVLLGRRVNLGGRVSRGVSPESVSTGRLERMPVRMLLGAMAGDGSHWDEGVYVRSAWVRRLISRKPPYMLGSTYSLEKSLVEEINGFNEEFVGYGGEDIEFEYRLRLAGARFKWVRHQAIQYHLYHEQKVVTPGNVDLVERTKALGRATCVKGLRNLETS